MPILLLLSTLSLITGKWDQRFEIAVRARHVHVERLALLGALLTAWGSILLFGLWIDVVGIHAELVIGLCLCTTAVTMLLSNIGLTSRTTGALTLPLAIFASFFPLFVGENTFLGTSVGEGLSPAFIRVSVAIFLLTGATWVGDCRLLRV